ncbi:hypothetical protein T31B1_09473 [Salinisphaera sp. T31B1]
MYPTNRVGDLITHGAECERVSEFLLKLWCHTSSGNYEWRLPQGARIVDKATWERAVAPKRGLSNAPRVLQMLLPGQEAAYFDISRVLVTLKSTRRAQHGA